MVSTVDLKVCLGVELQKVSSLLKGLRAQELRQSRSGGRPGFPGRNSLAYGLCESRSGGRLGLPGRNSLAYGFCGR